MLNIIKSKIYNYQKRKAELSSRYNWELLKIHNSRKVFYEISRDGHRKDLNMFFIEQFKDNLRWDELSLNSSVDIQMLLKYFKEYVDWEKISTRNDLSDELLILYFDSLREYSNLFDYRIRSANTLRFVVEHKQITDYEWIQISRRQAMDFSFILKYQKYLYPYYLQDNLNLHSQLRKSIPTTYDNKKRGIYE